ncbi:hypothetical protein LV564_02835 [Komagataeibacter nataicola]|uniref:hypothetical protein n=1 Tax=Komagataeibacter nataicola TaxID=265960 RepID=UPI0023DD1764|nr:hypothetical protein [Komagataeibacter nataicola]WEQ56058.1 hypothetical protein LV564_02835 [Komagataeibacter nataicola]
MSFGERVNQFDAWLLDRIFQPVADALPERLTAMDVGMSFQVGSIVLSAASISALLVLDGKLPATDALLNTSGLVQL